MTELTGLLRLAARVLLAVADAVDVLFAAVPDHVPESWQIENAEWIWGEFE